MTQDLDIRSCRILYKKSNIIKIRLDLSLIIDYL
jgi:hypothetical protein